MNAIFMYAYILYLVLAYIHSFLILVIVYCKIFDEREVVANHYIEK